MFDELDKYKETGHFFFRPNDNMNSVCNAPSDKAGVYIIYALRRGQIEIIYIGRSGEIKEDGSLFIRPGGIQDRLVNGKRDGELKRNFWVAEMLKTGIEALDIYWYVTHNAAFVDCPKIIENTLLKKHYDIYGRLPRWNTR